MRWIANNSAAAPMKSHEDDAGETCKRGVPVELTEAPATDERTGDAEHDVSNDAVAGTARHERSKRTCDETDDEPGEKDVVQSRGYCKNRGLPGDTSYERQGAQQAI